MSDDGHVRSTDEMISHERRSWDRYDEKFDLLRWKPRHNTQTYLNTLGMVDITVRASES